MWGLDEELKSWGYVLPSAEDLHAMLFKHTHALIEWNRIGGACAFAARTGWAAMLSVLC